MATFAIVKDDDVELVPRARLTEKRLMLFPLRAAKTRAKANVVQLKLRRKQA